MRDESDLTMPSRSSISNVFLALYLLGIALLLFGFLALIPDGYRNNTAWLDFFVVIIMYSVNFPIVATWRFRGENFSEKIPGVAILLWADPIYCLLALGIIYSGVIYRLAFRVQLFFQLSAVFGSLIVVAISWMASGRVRAVSGEEHHKRDTLQQLKDAISRCDARMATLGPMWHRERELCHKLREDARFLSPCVESTAISYEEEMVVHLDDICKLLDSDDPNRIKPDLDSQIAKCGTIMALRKQTLVH
jgi:hypothetical protein